MESDLLAGLASLIANTGAGTWQPTAAYASSQVGIYLDILPLEASDGIALACYPVDDPTVDNTSTVGVQVRYRAATAAAVRDRAGDVFSSLQGLWGATVGGVPVASSARQSSAMLPPATAGGPWERTDNYYLRVLHPTAHRL